MRTSLPTPALRQARAHLLSHGQCLPGLVSESLARSWQRSLAAGLTPTARVAPIDHFHSNTLRHTLAANHALLAHSRPVMEYLFEQVRDSQSVVALADRKGVLMHTLGSVDFLGRAERVALACGASWHENDRGTNAIGTALVEASPVEIHGSEHFLERNGFLTCAAAPIVSATGELLGILDVSGDQRGGHPHTLGLVSTAARMIENRLVVAECRRSIRLHLHAQPEGIGTVAEGIVAVSEDGWVVGANRAAMACLGLVASDLGAIRLEQVLDCNTERLLSHQVRRPGQALPLRTHKGEIYAQVSVDAALVRTVPKAVSAPASADVGDALARLDSGDARWRAAADKARKVLDKPIAILIQGESGVGKELFARAIHDSGPRKAGPFVAVNCAALPENLIEAELFGYVAGAFSGARKEGSAGRLREAHGGTLFLDEIGDMPLGLQTRLLRVLQERSVTPIGSGKALPVDFSLVCATHAKLRQAMEEGRFRSDLYYRINGLTLVLPPLRERTDFEALTQQLLASFQPQRPVFLASEVFARLSRHAWPGNIRQYASVLRTACAMLGPDESCIQWGHLCEDLLEELQAVPDAPAAPSTSSHNLQALSQSTIAAALEVNRGNVTRAAKSLGISRQTLYRKLDEARSRRTH
ncbi:MAG: sigma-54-dependent Fis family transcriptional regulator [Rhodoferax sp.]|nr:MAG: sigma-54-dependent Fis family transcriptional regulator [Rhodoferax sp.]